MKIMFQGDSITDAFRDRSDNHNLSGYTQKVSDILGSNYEYVNYACGGDTSDQMMVRHEAEFAKEIPDVLSLLIGINDIWRHYDGFFQFKVEKEKFIENVLNCINISKKHNPNVKIILIEPYLIPGSCMLYDQGLDRFFDYIKALKENATDKVDKYLVVNDDFMKAYNNGEIYSDDGVHPNELGQKYLAKRVAEAIKSL